MPYVNLIQEQRLSTQTNERKARTFFLAFVGISVASGAAFAFFMMESIFTRSQIAALETEAKKSAPMVAKIQEAQNSLGELTPRLKTLEDAQTVTDRWNRIMNHLAVQTPSSAWLTGMRCTASDPAKPIQISLVGVAPSQSPIGEFILRLQNLEDLENVNLKYTNEKLITNTKGIEFQVDADLVGTAEQKVKSEKDGEEAKK